MDNASSDKPHSGSAGKYTQMNYDEAFDYLTKKFDRDESGPLEARDSRVEDSPRTVLVDSGGYLGLADVVNQAKPFVPLSRTWAPELDSQVSIMHYLLRSSIVLKNTASGEDRANYQRFSESCLSTAVRALKTLPSIPNPAWVGEFKEKVRPLRLCDPEIFDRVQVSVALRPQIYAFSFPSAGRIEISAVVREHLRTINLLLSTIGTLAMNKATRPDGHVEGRNLVDLLLVHIFALYFPNANYSALPIIRTVDERTLIFATEVATRQAELLLAHEYAHMLFHEGKRPSVELEMEADQFAFNVVSEISIAYPPHNPYQVYVAGRWLFLYLALDRVVGAALSGYEIDWTDLPIRERDRHGLLGAVGQTRDAALWAGLGDLILFEAKYVLKFRGADWIMDAARAFQERFCFK